MELMQRWLKERKSLARASLEGILLIYPVYFIANAPYAISFFLDLPKAHLKYLIFILHLFFSFGYTRFEIPVLSDVFVPSLTLLYIIYVKLRTKDTSFKQGLKASAVLFLFELFSKELAPSVGIGVLWSKPIAESVPMMLEWARIIAVTDILVSFLFLNFLSTVILVRILKSRKQMEQQR